MEWDGKGVNDAMEWQIQRYGEERNSGKFILSCWIFNRNIDKRILNK